MNEEVKDQKKKKLTKKQLITFILVLFIFIIGISIAILSTKSREKKEKDDIQEEKNIIANASTYANDFDGIVTLLKNYYYNNSLAQADNISYWYIDEIYYIGKYKGSDTEYFKITGYYKCNDNQNTCLNNTSSTQPNENNEYNFKIYAGINNKQVQNLQDKMKKENFVTKEEYIRNKSKLSIDVGSELMNYYYDSDIANSDQLTAWTVETQYEKTIDNKIYYLVTSSFSCKDNTSSCINLQQPLTKNQYDEYDFKLSVIGTANKDNFTLESVNEIM